MSASVPAVNPSVLRPAGARVASGSHDERSSSLWEVEGQMPTTNENRPATADKFVVATNATQKWG
jgi:hypothetical protein